MSRRPTVESDSEGEEFDDDTDLPLPSKATLANTGAQGALLEELGATSVPSASTSSSQPQAFTDAFASMGLGGGTPDGIENDPMFKQYAAARAASAGAQVIPPGSEKLNEFKNWTCIYPIYIDAKRAYGTGQRRIAREKSVWWPRSQEIAQAALKCGLRVFHEPTKRHPRDWENPGRVKVLWKKEGALVNPRIPTKKVLFEMVSTQIHVDKPEWKPDMSKISESESVSAPRLDSKPAGGGTGGKHTSAKGSAASRQQQQPYLTQQNVISRRKPLPKPPLPLPPLSDRVSPYSPMISSGALLDLWKPGPVDKNTPAGAGGPDVGAGAGKGKRKVIRVRG